MLKRLIDIRNMVEHQGSGVPPIDECLMFADLVWYFLRSTDPLVRNQGGKLLFEPPGAANASSESRPEVELNFDGENFSELPDIRAWLDPSSLSYEQGKNWIKIQNAEVATYVDEESARLWVHGRMCGTEEQKKLIYDTYFKRDY